ncbi:hypothetical protein HDU96_004299, partial [Phlyctochytrium bullatum]
MAVISIMDLDCDELERIDDAGRLHANHAYGPPGSNNIYYNFRQRLLKLWLNGSYVIHIAPAVGNSPPVPMVLNVPCKMVNTRAALVSGGGKFTLNALQPARGFGAHNHRLCLGVQMATDRAILDRLLIHIGEAVGAVPKFRDFDLRSNCTLLTKTEWLRPGMNVLANPPTPAARLLEYTAATVLRAEQVMDTFVLPSGVLFQPVYDGRGISTPPGEFFPPSARHSLPCLNLNEAFEFNDGDVVLA